MIIRDFKYNECIYLQNCFHTKCKFDLKIKAIFFIALFLSKHKYKIIFKMYEDVNNNDTMITWISTIPFKKIKNIINFEVIIISFQVISGFLPNCIFSWLELSSWNSVSAIFFFFLPRYIAGGILPDQGSKPNLCLLQWEHGILTTELPGKSFFFFILVFITCYLLVFYSV